MIVFIIGEIYFRIAFDIGINYQLHKPVTYHEKRGWALIPGEYNNFSRSALRLSNISINSLGLRNTEITPAVPEGKKRVTIVGDSFVYAEVLNVGERFTDQLQDLQPDTEVVNVSVPGYGTGQQILLLEELWAKGYETGDKVVLVFFTNDILDNMGLDYSSARRNPRAPIFSIDEKGQLAYSTPPNPNRNKKKKKELLTSSIFYAFLRDTITNLVSRQPWILRTLDKLNIAVTFPRVPGIINAWYSEGWGERWEVTRDILGYSMQQIRNRGIKLSIAFIPSPLQVEEAFKEIVMSSITSNAKYSDFIQDINRPQRMLEEFCAEHGIPFIDTTDSLQQASKSRPAYFLREGHLNEYGSQIVSKALHQSLF